MHYMELLNDKGLKATAQRISVLRNLSKHTHPTVDELYEEIKKEYPSISLATVYKNLSTLVDCGLVVEVNRPNKKPKFDIFEHPHIHVMCKNCSEVFDYEEDASNLNKYKKDLEKKLGNTIDEINMVAIVNSCKFCKD